MNNKADYIDIVELAYNFVLDDKTWLHEITEAAYRCLDLETGLAAYYLDSKSPSLIDHSSMTCVDFSPELAGRADSAFANAPPGMLSFFSRNQCSTLSTFVDDSGPRNTDARTFFRKYIYPQDTIGIAAKNPDESGVVLATLLPEVTELSRFQLSQWERVAAHITAGLKMRQALKGIVKYSDDVSSTGEVFLDPVSAAQCTNDNAKPNGNHHALRDTAVAIDRARSALQRVDPLEVNSLWRRIIAGRWSLIDNFSTNGRRYYVAHRNNSDVRDLRALTQRELQVVASTAVGNSNKQIARNLRLARPTVAAHIASAKKKLGVSSRTELVRVAVDLSSQAVFPLQEELK